MVVIEEDEIGGSHLRELRIGAHDFGYHLRSRLGISNFERIATYQCCCCPVVEVWDRRGATGDGSALEPNGRGYKNKQKEVEELPLPTAKSNFYVEGQAIY